MNRKNRVTRPAIAGVILSSLFALAYGAVRPRTSPPPGYTSFTGWTRLDPGIAIGMQTDAFGNAYLVVDGPIVGIYAAKIAADDSIVYSTQIDGYAFTVTQAGQLWYLGEQFGNNYLVELDGSGNAIQSFPLPSSVALGHIVMSSDATGHLYIAGTTYSPSADLGIGVVELDSSGNLVATQQIAASGRPYGIAVDPAGNVYIAGQTSASSFPTTPGAYQRAFPASFLAGGGMGFVVKYAPTLDHVLYSTLLGGNGGNGIMSVAADAAGNAYVAGTTVVSFPGLVPLPVKQVGLPLSQMQDGQLDVFAAKLDPSGSNLLWALGLGPVSGEPIESIVVSPDGRVHVAAGIFSNFAPPLTAGVFTISAGGDRLEREQFIPGTDHPGDNPSLQPSQENSALVAIALGANGALRVLTHTASQTFPPTYNEQLPGTPVVVDLPATPVEANLSVTGVSLKPLVPGGDYTVRVTIKNNGPDPADGIEVGLISDGISYFDGCSGGPYICYTGWAVVPTIQPGESVWIDLQYRYTDSVIPGKTNVVAQVGVIPMSSDVDMSDNFTSVNVPLVTGAPVNIYSDMGDLVYERSDLFGACDSDLSACDAITSADSALSVRVPTPQLFYGNWWDFVSWADGNTANPRTFDASNGVPLTQGRMLFRAEQAVGTDPPSLDFVALPGSAPNPCTIMLWTTFPGTASFAVGNPTASWLKINTGTFLANFAYSLTGQADTTGLSPGYYTAAFPVTISANEEPTATYNVPASLRIMDSPPTLQSPAVVNAASGQSTALAPMEIIDVLGTGLGPDKLQGGRMPATGLLPSSLGGTQVLVDGWAASLVFVQANRIEAVVPTGLGTYMQSVPVTVEIGGIAVLSATIPWAIGTYYSQGESPGLFTADSSGSGGLAAVNADGTLNTPANPAARNTMVLLYATGIAGAPYPLGYCDQQRFGSSLLERVQAGVEVDIGGEPAEVIYAGTAPDETCGLEQLNVVIPADATVGPAVPVQLHMFYLGAGYSAQDGVTLAIM